MHTLLVVAVGFALLTGAWAGGQALGAPRAALLAFLVVWLLGAALNMYVGVARAGYSVRDEFPIFLVVYAVPASVALWLWWRRH